MEPLPMYDRHGRCRTLPPHAWMHPKGTDALLSAIENADGDTFERHVIPDTLSEAERIDCEMEQRGGLLRAIEIAPEPPRTPENLWLPALIGFGLLAGALIINVIVGGGQ